MLSEERDAVNRLGLTENGMRGLFCPERTAGAGRRMKLGKALEHGEAENRLVLFFFLHRVGVLQTKKNNSWCST